MPQTHRTTTSSSSSSTTRYLTIADTIARQIEQGVYAVGQRIPSIRQGVRQHGVSPGTLLQAYHKLEDRGFIRAQPQSGYYVRQRATQQLQQPTASATSRRPQTIHVNLAVEMLRRMSQKDVLQLGAAVPDASFMPSGLLSRRLSRVVRHHSSLIHCYGPLTGLPRMRQLLARFMAEANCKVDPDELIVTNGCTEALNLCLRAVTKPGDTVAIESPTYYGLLIALKGLGLKALPIRTCPATGLCVEALIDAAKNHTIAAVVLAPSFANPTGSCMPLENRQKLVAWADRTSTPVIEDDIYGELHFDAKRPTPLTALSSKGMALYCSSTSKTLSAGFRVGWCVPGKYLQEVEELKAGINPTTSIGPQLALCDFLETGGVHQHLRRLRRLYRDQVDYFCDGVTRHLPGRIGLHRPAGGHLLWIELDRHIDTAKLFEQALAKKISVAPGMIFTPNGELRHHLRLNVAVPWIPKVDRAIKTLGQIMEGMG